MPKRFAQKVSPIGIITFESNGVFILARGQWRPRLIIPGFRAMKPAPKIAITRFGAGVHSFWKAEKDLPVGIVPSVIKSWNEAVMNGYFAP